MAYVPDIQNKVGKVILENKIHPTGELPHKAFGAYREYWRKYQNDYDFFAFLSDDVLIKADNWLLDAVDMLSSFERLGFVGTQIFNGMKKQYPHSSHCRAPCWFAKSSALASISWTFNSDHDGEMRLADQFLEAGFFGAQVGNKIDTAYDATENGGHYVGDHVSAQMETKLGHDIHKKFSYLEKVELNKNLKNRLSSSDDSMLIKSPHKHIGSRRIVSQLQPFHGLVFDKSRQLAAHQAEDCPFGISILKKYL